MKLFFVMGVMTVLCFVTGCVCCDDRLVEYLSIRDALKRVVEYKIDGDDLSLTIEQGMSMIPEKRLALFAKELGADNLSGRLLIERQLPTATHELSVGKAALMVRIIAFRGGFGESLVMEKDIRDLKWDRLDDGSIRGTCSFNVLNTLRGRLLFTAQRREDGYVVTRLGIAAKGSTSMSDMWPVVSPVP